MTIQIDTDTVVQSLWFVRASVCLFAACYAWLVWGQVRGIRGLAIAVLVTALTLISLSSALLHSPESNIPAVWLLAISRGAWWPLIFAGLVLVDIWAADHNDHRSLTTITYQWFKRTVANGRARERSHARDDAQRVAW